MQFSKNTILCDLARKYRTDKVKFGYTRIYDSYFSSIKKNVRKLLEIGIKEGRSLRMWKQYFEKANIYGLDIKNCSNIEEDRIFTFIGNQNSIRDLKKFSDEYDIIVDDGSHLQKDILRSFNFLFNYVCPGGFYIIEDVWSLMDKNGKRKPKGQWGVKDKDFSDSVTSIMKNFKRSNIEFVHIYYAYKYPLTKLGTSNLIIIKKKK